jgi:malate synthase
MEIFDRLMPAPNQLDRMPDKHSASRDDLLEVPEGQITEAGLRGNVNVAIRYLNAWLSGNGCVPIDHLMEDAATAEIARAQIWQWARYPRGCLEDGRDINLGLFDEILEQELGDLCIGQDAAFRTRAESAAELLRKLIHEDEFIEFLTLPAYELLP